MQSIQSDITKKGIHITKIIATVAAGDGLDQTPQLVPSPAVRALSGREIIDKIRNVVRDLMSLRNLQHSDRVDERSPNLWRIASRTPGEIAVCDPIPDYTPDEDEAAEKFWKDRIDPRSAVLPLSGNACAVKVEKGELLAFDDGRLSRFAKVTHGLKAIVFLGQSGSLTLDAIKWCEAQSVAVCLLDWYGELLSVTQPTLKTDVAIRRAQFAADRLKVAKAILRQKLAAQVRIGKLSQASYRSDLSQILKARSVEEVIAIEARAALDYWSNWNFELKHRKRNWPDQWTRFAYRASPISGGPRHAMHPVNAILNYAYSIAAAQVTRALQASGFDSAAGFLHADAEGRHSLTYDVMELLRADVDQVILPWIASHTWKRPDFPVTPEGIVRLQPTLAAAVAQRAMLGRKSIDGAVEWLSDLLVPMQKVSLGRSAATL